ncbi:sensor histidine kinase [Promicromonospora kroppenstedtii]|uniref:histidine kinase n=1 Tax=Promicromonospora kroppenstedtii TaxID=440482 RepID=A0ABW7XNR3_9MICO
MDSTARPELRSRAWLTATIVLAVLGLSLAATGVQQPVAVLVTVLGAAGIALGVMVWALVRTGRQRRAYEDELTAWAAERAAQAERLRIARDLHDLASHGLGLITVRAAAARTLTGPAGEVEHARALADIEQAGRAATTELRRMLTVLRTPGGENAPLRPAETLTDLPGVVDSARVAGVDVTLELDHLGDVSAGAQLTVCVVVREALANIARHAGPTAARVAVLREADAIVLTVEDDGPVAGWYPHPGAGQGLAGLRERVAALGGTLHAGAGTDGAGPGAGPGADRAGFRVVARLPDHPSGGPMDRGPRR